MRHFRVDRSAAADATPTGNFGGQVWMQRMIGPGESADLELLVVSFEAGGRTRPHTHPVDQILQIVSGRGLVVTRGERRVVEPGDVVVVPAGEWHWHGATPDSPMTHISVKRHGATDWGVDEGEWAAY